MAKKLFYYFREFRTIEGVDCSSLTLQERLFLSVILTKLRTKDTRTFADILFNGVSSFTRKGFEDFDKLVTSVIQKKYGRLFDWLVESADKVNVNKTSKSDKYIVHAITIDTAKLFYTKNGSHGSSLAALAWKAFALAAASSSTEVSEWRELDLFAWMEDDMPIEKRVKVNKTQMKRAIQSWLKAVGITGTFKVESFIVDAKGFDSKLTDKERGWSKPKSEPEDKPVIEETVKPEVVEEEDIDEDEGLTPEEAEAEKEWRRQEASIDFTMAEEPDVPAFKYDKTDDWSKYSREDWAKWYDVTKANYEAKAAKADKDTPKWSSLLNEFYTPGSKYYDFVRHDGEEIKAIAKKLKVKVSDIDAVISGKRIEGADWQVKKDSIRRALKDLQDSVIMKAQDRDIWDADEYPRIAKIYVGFACKNYKYMKVDL